MENEEITVPVWWVPGNGMMYNRSALPTNHPESTYRYIKDQLGLVPEHYGYRSNEAETLTEYDNKSRLELIQEICELKSIVFELESFLS